MKNVGVLISGRGTNLQALIDAVAGGRLGGRIAVVISNVEDAPGLERARKAEIPAHFRDHRGRPRDEFDQQLVALLREHAVDLVCLAGYMRLLSPALIRAFAGRILNVHPSLLPAFPGLEAQRQAWEHGARPDALKARPARGPPLRVKVGFHPTAPDIHLGHTVLMRKMRHFQALGPRVIFVIGDFTGMIGDPSGKSKTRPPLSREEIERNAETYKKQAFKVLHAEKTEIRFNREWLGALGSDGMVRLAATYNVARMLERREFRQRYEAGQAISVHEFLYPLAQAYDYVALKADVELGGSDQLFNLNVGRDIMPAYGLEPQVVMTTPLLEGLDGVEKMSKSLGNTIGVTDSPDAMFAKVMSISDELMWRYYLLLTDLSAAEIEAEKAKGEP